jgi:hypothetical protein
VGAPLGIILLEGQNFTSNSTVLFDGEVSNFVFFHSSTEIQIEIDVSITQVAGNHTIQVQDPANGNSAVLTFSVYQMAAGPQEFQAVPTTYIAGETEPFTGVLADFNGDGFDDVVFASTGTQTLYLLHGQADGTFSPAIEVPFTWTGQVDGLLAGDLNGDGHPDLVVVASDNVTDPTTPTTRITTFLNDGTGNLQPFTSTTYPQQPFARSILADFRGTGHLDLMVGSQSASGEMLFFPGQGDGSFGTPTPFGLPGPQCVEMEVADFNGDGLPDILYEANNGEGVDEIRLLVNQGNGMFMDTQPASLANITGPFAIGDFNNDHKPDVVFLNNASIAIPVAVMLGQGDGTFIPGTSISKPQIGQVETIVPGDLDGDGNTDLITTTNINGPDQAAIFWGDGTGNFSLQFITEETSGTPLIGDVNGDGISDLVQIGRFYFAGATLGRSDRKFSSPPWVTPQIAGFLSAGDALGDGFQDLMVSGNIIGNDSFLGSIYHIQPDGTFKQIGSTPPGGSFLVDMDGDGIADLVGSVGNNLAVWKGDGSGDYSSLSPVFQFPLSGDTNIVVADVDHDGIPDIIIGGMIFYGKGGMAFDPVTLPAGANEPFAVGDFDGDGNVDIATQSGIMFGMGNRTFSAPTGIVPLFASSPNQSGWVVADLDGNGKDDLIFTDDQSFVVIASGKGRAGIFSDQEFNVGDVIGSISVADFNGDGRLDILATTELAEDAVLFTNNGNGTYSISSFGTGAGSIGGIVADFNHDGKPDLAIMNFVLDFRPTNVVIVLHK